MHFLFPKPKLQPVYFIAKFSIFTSAMMDLLFTERVVESKDWATVLFVLCFAVLAINRSVFEVRFSEFVKIAISDKYLKIYKDSGNMNSWFTISMFLIQLISFAFLIQITLSYFEMTTKTNWISYIQIVTLLGVFILSKYLIEKIIATTFNIEEFNEQFNLQKVNYRTYIGLLILPVNILLFYNDFLSKTLLLVIISIILIINMITYFFSLKNYQNLILSKFFYFILYLCALEIAPYYFMYYWFTKS
ncbi:hypothetical protein FLJC2902T_02050 [Flavobacterium limnosediminis JC2902]|uniref:DUF4271 domain-containing protein n=2 Tax=Flavobacterium TaxID=237 RepID=V6SSX3_9FLAO|nr:hypothetical protein FLJC2902T_02050 [Flavobacterium limnosediminis JC2902]